MRKAVIIVCFAFSLCFYSYAQPISTSLTAQGDDSTEVLTRIINAVRNQFEVDLYKKAHSQIDSLGINYSDSLCIENAATFLQSLKSSSEFEEVLRIIFNINKRGVPVYADVYLETNEISVKVKYLSAVKKIKNFINYIDKNQKLPREQYEYLMYKYSIKAHERERVNATYVINVDENGELIVLHREIIISD